MQIPLTLNLEVKGFVRKRSKELITRCLFLGYLAIEKTDL